MTGQTDADIPETGAIFTFGKSSFADSIFWLKNDHPVHMSGGGEHTAVITDSGRILMFGANTCGQLGLGFKPASSKPASVRALKSETVKLVACGRDHTIVCTLQGCVYGSGSNQEGQLGLGHCSNTTSFTLLPPFCDHAPVRMLSAGCNTSAALTEDGRLFMWGDNSVGQIGLGDVRSAAEPTEVDVGETVVWVSCGYYHSAFVTVDGGLYTFGESANGRLGLQTEQLANHRVPQRVQGILGRVIQVSCGGEHTAALTEESVCTFGRGQYGQLGHGTFLFEVDLPKPLEHFSNSGVRHISCGGNHTAVITENGRLYTFGDGRHGKLGSGEENFTNQFSPTLCSRFLKHNVQLVSCGCDHMLVLAAPRPPESQEVVVPEKDVEINDSLLRSEMLLLDALMDPTQLVPKSAFAARARRREKESSVDLFGEMFQNLPRLNSDFLNASWQTSRNVLTPRTRSKDVTALSSPPKPLSDVTPSPPLSPAPLSESSKPSSSHSQSSLQSKSHVVASSTSEPRDFHSPLLSPKSITKRNPNVPFPKRIGRNRVQHMSSAKKALNSRMSSHSTHVPTTGLREREGLASSQTEGENVQRQVISEDLQKRREVDSDILPDTEKKKGRALRRTTKDDAAFAEQLQSEGKTDQISPRAFPAELLKGFSSLKKEESATKKKNHKVTSKGKENITKQPNKIKNQDEEKALKELYHVKSTKHSKNNSSELNKKTPQSIHLTKARQRATEIKESGRKSRNLQEVHINQEDVTELIGTPKQEEAQSSALDKTSPVIKAREGHETNSMSFQRGSSNIRGNAAEEDVKRAQIKRTDIKPTPTRDVHKVKSAAGKGQSKKLSLVKKGNITPEKVRVTSTPVKVKEKQQPLKSKHEENNAVQSGSEGPGAEKSVNSTDLRIKGKPAEEQKLPDKKEEKEKPAWDEGEEIKDKGEADTKDNTGAKFLQASEPADRDLLVSQRENKESEDEPMLAQILSNAAAVLPAVGMVGAAVEVLGEAVTRVQADSDTAVSTPSRASNRGKQFTKQSAIRQLSFASTLSSTESSHQEDENAKKHAEVSVPFKPRNRVQEDDRDQSEHEEVKSDTSKQTMVEDFSQTEEKKNRSTQLNTFQQDHEEGEDEDQETSKVSREDVGEEDESKKGEDRDTEDENGEGESVSNVEHKEEEEEEDGEKSSSDKEDEAESVSGEGEQEGDGESEEEEGEEETNSSSEEEDKGSERNNRTEIEEEEEGEEEESSEVMGEGGSECEAVEEEEDGSEESSKEEREEEEDESEVIEDEEDESGEELGSTTGSKSEEEEEEEEEEREGSDTAESGGSDEAEDEEEENEVEEEGETEEQKDDQDSTESEDEERDSEDEESDESEGDEENDETQDEVSVEIEEEEEEDNEGDEEEEEQDEKREKEDEECEEEELSDEGESEREEEREDVTVDEEEEGEEEVAEGEEEEEEEKIKKKEKSMKGNKKARAETEEEEEEGDDEEDGEEEENKTTVNSTTEMRLKNQRQEQFEQKKDHETEENEDEERQESEEDTDEGGEEAGEEEQEEKKEGLGRGKVAKAAEDKHESEEEEEEDEDEEEEGKEEREEEEQEGWERGRVAKVAEDEHESEEDKEEVEGEDEEEGEEEEKGEEEEEGKEEGEEEEQEGQDRGRVAKVAEDEHESVEDEEEVEGEDEEEGEEEEEGKEEGEEEEEQEVRERGRVAMAAEDEHESEEDEEEEEGEDEEEGKDEGEEEEQEGQERGRVAKAAEDEHESEEGKEEEEGEDEEEGEEEEEGKEEGEEEEQEGRERGRVAKAAEDEHESEEDEEEEEGEDEEEGEEEEEGKEQGEEEEQEGQERGRVAKAAEDKHESEEDEEEEEGEDEEEGEEEEEGKDEEEGEEEEEGEDEEEGEEEAEEEEEEEGDEEEEETETKRKDTQKLPPDRKEKLQREKPEPAPRTRQRTAGEKNPEEEQKFWNNVLPQYLDLQ